MASRLLNVADYPELDPIGLLERYVADHPGGRFDCTDEETAAAWQQRMRAELNDAIGFQDLPAVDFAEEIIEQVERPDHIRQKITIRTTDRKRLVFYLLKPIDAAGPRPVILAFHGHGYGVKDIVGLWEDGEERYTPDGYHRDFAAQLVRAGFVVAAPEIMSFGEHVPDTARVDTAGGAPIPSPCHWTSTYAMMAGGTVLGLRVFEAKRLVDYLTRVDGVDIDRLGAMGISGGGMHTFFSTCLDERIRACVISGYFCSWFRSILAMHHCICNFVPGILKLGDLPELAALLAPGPVLVEAGTRDSIFPIDAVRGAVDRLKDIYRVWGMPERVELDEFEGRHQISGRRAYDFLRETLAGRPV